MSRSDFDQRSFFSESASRPWPSLLLAVLPAIVALILSGFIFSKGTAGFQIEKTQDCFVIARVDAGLNPVEAGDCITHIGGVGYHDVLGYLLNGRFDGRSADRITLRRDGRTIHMALHYAGPGLIQFIKSAGPYWVFTLLSLILCLSVLRWAPAGQPGGLFILTLSSFTLLFVCQFPIQFGILLPALQSAAALTTVITNWIGFSAWLHFTLRFPVQQQIWQGRRLRITAVYLLPPAVAIAAALILSHGGSDFFGWLQRLRRWAAPLIIMAILAKQWHDLHSARSAMTRNQLRLICAGSTIGISVYFCLYLIPGLAVGRPLVPFYMVALSAVLIPVSLFMALVRYRLLDVDRIISWTVAHMILIGGLYAIYSGILYGLKNLMWGQGAATESVFLLFIVLIAFFFAPVRDRLQQAIDVLFFGQNKDYRSVLHGFSSNVAAAIRMSDLTRIIVDQVPVQFNLSQAALVVFAAQDRRVYPQGHPARQVLKNLQAIPSALKSGAAFMFLAPDHPEKAAFQEMELLWRYDFQLVLRLQSRTAFTGMLLLGSKHGNAIYSGRDIQVLSIFANQAATAVENALNYESLERSQAALKKMFTKVVQAEKLATIGEMTTVLAHEIRNPLGVIRSSAQFLTADRLRKEDGDELLGFIVDEVDRLTQVVNNLLGLARYAPPDFKPVALHELLSSIIERWRLSDDHNPRVVIQCRCTFEESILADRQQLVQVVMNLIRNSEDAMSDGGRIDIRIDAEPHDDGIVLRLTDTGPGVTPEQVGKLWQKFYTTKRDGVGLGLPLCKQIVQAHGGTIQITSPENHGLMVIIRLPQRPESIIPAAAGDLAGPKPSSAA